MNQSNNKPTTPKMENLTKKELNVLKQLVKHEWLGMHHEHKDFDFFHNLWFKLIRKELSNVKQKIN
tara:strand:- start:4910 stop:5107 length:198 start_codon:yes stop_codon:yes gene_type:complete